MSKYIFLHSSPYYNTGATITVNTIGPNVVGMEQVFSLTDITGDTYGANVLASSSAPSTHGLIYQPGNSSLPPTATIRNIRVTWLNGDYKDFNVPIHGQDHTPLFTTGFGGHNLEPCNPGMWISGEGAYSGIVDTLYSSSTDSNSHFWDTYTYQQQVLDPYGVWASGYYHKTMLYYNLNGINQFVCGFRTDGNPNKLATEQSSINPTGFNTCNATLLDHGFKFGNPMGTADPSGIPPATSVEQHFRQLKFVTVAAPATPVGTSFSPYHDMGPYSITLSEILSNTGLYSDSHTGFVHTDVYTEDLPKCFTTTALDVCNDSSSLDYWMYTGTLCDNSALPADLLANPDLMGGDETCCACTYYPDTSSALCTGCVDCEGMLIPGSDGEVTITVQDNTCAVAGHFEIDISGFGTGPFSIYIIPETGSINGIDEAPVFYSLTGTSLILDENTTYIANNTMDAATQAAVGFSSITYAGTPGTPPLAGEYVIIIIEDQYGCIKRFKSSNTTMLSHPPLVVTGSVFDSSCSVPINSVQVDVTGGLPPFTYSWSGPNSYTATTQDIYGVSPAGTYTITVEDADTPACQVIVDFIVGDTVIDGCIDPSADNYNPSADCDDGSCLYCNSLNATMSSTPVTCFGGSDGTATASPYGGSGSYTYWWNTSPAQTTATATGVPYMTVACLIIDTVTGCTIGPNVVVGGHAEMVMAVDLVNDAFCGNNGALIAYTGGGNPPYTYNWSTGPVVSSAATNTLSNLAPGTYTCYVTDSAGCPPSLTATNTIVELGVYGCTDPFATNYDSTATCDDGSCTLVTQPDPTITFIDTACEVSLEINWPGGIANPQIDYLEILYTDGMGSTTTYTIQGVDITTSIDFMVGEDNCTSMSFSSIGLPITPTITLIKYFTSTSSTQNTGAWGIGALGAITSIASSSNVPVICGCTNSLALNYNASATCDDGSCITVSSGCTDDGSMGQTWWDGTNAAAYDYATATGINTYQWAQASNYNASYNVEDGSCIYTECPGCCDSYDPISGVQYTGATFNNLLGGNPDCSMVIRAWNACLAIPFVPILMEIHTLLYYNGSSWVFVSQMNFPVVSIGVYSDWVYSCPLGIDGFMGNGDGDYKVVITQTLIDGTICTDETPTITMYFPECGCTISTATNYNPTATCDDGSCTFTSNGCGFNLALNPIVSCNYGVMNLSISGGTGPFTYNWYEVSNPSVTLNLNNVNTSTLNILSTAFMYAPNVFICEVTDALGCTETIYWSYPGTPWHDPYWDITVDSLPICDGDLPNPPLYGGSYSITSPVNAIVTIVSVSVTGPSGFTSINLMESNLEYGTYIFEIVLSNGCTEIRTHVISWLEEYFIEGCTNPLYSNYSPASGCDDGNCYTVTVTSTDFTCADQFGTITIDIDAPNIVYPILLEISLLGAVVGTTVINSGFTPYTFSNLPVGVYTVTYQGDNGTFQQHYNQTQTIQNNTLFGCMDAVHCNYDPSANCPGICDYQISISTVGSGDCALSRNYTITSPDPAIDIVDVTWAFIYDLGGGGQVTEATGSATGINDNYYTVGTNIHSCSSSWFGSGNGTYTMTFTVTNSNACYGAINGPGETITSLPLDCGCNDCPTCSNYNGSALCPDDCIGCTDPTAVGGTYDPGATVDDGSCCTIEGCMDATACNFNAAACFDDGSCTYCCTFTNTASSTPITCFGDSDGTATITTTGGSGSYTYLWNDGQTTATIVGMIPGTPACTVTDTVTGCFEWVPVVILGVSAVQLFLQITHDTCNSNGIVEAIGNGGTLPYTYLWGGGETTQTISSLSAGTYTCQITDANSCISVVGTAVVLDNGVYGCIDNDPATNGGIALNYDASVTCDDGSCVYPDILCDLIQTTSGTCLQQFTLTVSDPTNITPYLPTTLSYDIMYDPAGANTIQNSSGAITLAVPGTYSEVLADTCASPAFTLAGDYNIVVTTVYPDGQTITCTTSTITYTPLVCDCTDAAATNYNAAATCDDGSCVYATALTCSFTLNTITAGCEEDCLIFAEDTTSGLTITSHSWILYEDPTGTNTVWGTGSQTGVNVVNTNQLMHAPCSIIPWDPVLNNTEYNVVITVTYTNGQTATCTTNTITTSTILCGCTDAQAANYDATATCDDGSCTYPCCDTPVLTPTVNNLGQCYLEYEATLNCNTVSTDNAETVVASLQHLDGFTWIPGNVTTYNPTPGSNAITSSTFTYLYDCLTGVDEYGGFATPDGDYRVEFTITYVSGYVCTQTSNTVNLTFGECGCTDPTADNYISTADCDDGSCIYTYCCDTPVLVEDNTSVCAPVLDLNVNCSPNITGFTAVWQVYNTASSTWVTINTDVSTTAASTVSITLANSFLHTSASTESYRVLYTSTYSSVPDCSITSNTIAYTPPAPPVVGCMDNTAGDNPDINGDDSTGTPCTYPCAQGYLVSDFDPAALCPGPCCINGCTDATANNYDAAATCDDGSCTYDCCSLVLAVDNIADPCAEDLELTFTCTGANPTTADITWEYWDGTAWVFAFFDQLIPATTGDTSTLVNAFLILGGETDYRAVVDMYFASVPDCQQIATLNYTFPPTGCMDPAATNYDAAAICDDGSCTYPVLGCTDPTATNYNYNCALLPVVATLDDGCCFTCVPDCATNTNGPYSNYNSSAECDCDGTWVNDPAGYTPLSSSENCCTACLLGCTDPTASNYDPAATCDDGSCLYCIDGCTDHGNMPSSYNNSLGGTGSPMNPAAALNYDPTATCDDGTCCYEGCMDPTASNYDANYCADCAGNPSNIDISCCTYPPSGCMDNDPATNGGVALNYDASATVDDGSCLYCGSFTSSSYSGTAYVLDNALADTTTIWLNALNSITNASLGAATDGSANIQIVEAHPSATIIYINIFDNAGVTVGSSSGPPTSGTTYTFPGLGYGDYTAILSFDSVPVFNTPGDCDSTFSFTVMTLDCTDAAAVNTTSIPSQYVIGNSTLCYYTGDCACTSFITSLPGPACSGYSIINANITCSPATDISWQLLDNSGTIILSGTDPGVVNSSVVNQQITTAGTYTFEYTEDSTPFGTCPLNVNTVIVTSTDICGCTDPTMANYDSSATLDCNGDPVGTEAIGWNDDPCCLECAYGCTDPAAFNYDPLATCDDGTCIMPGDGCCDPLATNFNSYATNCVPEMCEYCND